MRTSFRARVEYRPYREYHAMQSARFTCRVSCRFFRMEAAGPVRCFLPSARECSFPPALPWEDAADVDVAGDVTDLAAAGAGDMNRLDLVPPSAAMAARLACCSSCRCRSSSLAFFRSSRDSAPSLLSFFSLSAFSCASFNFFSRSSAARFSWMSFSRFLICCRAFFGSPVTLTDVEKSFSFMSVRWWDSRHSCSSVVCT
mmetsp:Transcript_47132/g.118710  ORF Transcript_47132/g.118710 Transcript_47132/m.118710 type:complete len:200 (-) Transcript_47132:362-961(-)